MEGGVYIWHNFYACQRNEYQNQGLKLGVFCHWAFVAVRSVVELDVVHLSQYSVCSYTQLRQEEEH